MPRTKKKQNASNFFDDVYEVVKLVPKGRVTTYGAIANYLGLKSSARMVGWAMNGAPSKVPAHRVVNRTGLLTGKHAFKDPNTMEKRLRREGVMIIDDQIINFTDVFWDPATELA